MSPSQKYLGPTSPSIVIVSAIVGRLKLRNLHVDLILSWRGAIDRTDMLEFFIGFLRVIPTDWGVVAILLQFPRVDGLFLSIMGAGPQMD